MHTLTGMRLRRMSGIWGGQSALDLYLQEHGITTLFFAGVNADQVSISLPNLRRGVGFLD